MQGFQVLRPSSFGNACLHCDGGGTGRVSASSLLLSRSQSNGSASTSRLLEKGVRRRGSRVPFVVRAGRGVCDFGPASWATAEKVLRVWEGHRYARKKASWIAEVASPPKEATETSADSAPASDGARFDWKTNWYPVIPEIDLDKSVPYAFHVLGRKVVFWHDKAGSWNCVLDVCPHRLAPLSEGRIDEQGCLQCSYHAWSFRGDGSCANIPQARKEGPESSACEQSRARAVPLPVVVKQGMLFVWPDEHSPELASRTEPPITPGIDAEGWCAVGTFRDLPYGYESGMENLADPSHIPVAHHNVNGGILGNRKQAAPLELEIKSVSPTGFEAEMKKVSGPPSIHTFDAPARFTYAFQMRNIKGARGVTTTYCTPTRPGYCRLVIVNARNVMIGLSSGPAWWQFFPRWLDHQLMLNLLDGDVALLHGQERHLREKTGGEMEKWNKAYFMPTTADRYVGALRQWLTRHAGKGVQWAEGVDQTLPPLITKTEELLDRYATHSKHCRVCSRALENFKKARKVFFVLAALLLGMGTIFSNPGNRVQAVILAAIAGLLGYWMGGWIQMFYYKGWDHARNP